jgi:hypothetical protein
MRNPLIKIGWSVWVGGLFWVNSASGQTATLTASGLSFNLTPGLASLTEAFV